MSNANLKNIAMIKMNILSCYLKPYSGESNVNMNRKSKPVPGWNEHIKPYAEESKFWFNIWKSDGSPQSGPVFENMRHRKKQFKFAVRRLKRCNNRILNDKFIKV